MWFFNNFCERNLKFMRVSNTTLQPRMVVVSHSDKRIESKQVTMRETGKTATRRKWPIHWRPPPPLVYRPLTGEGSTSEKSGLGSKNCRTRLGRNHGFFWWTAGVWFERTLAGTNRPISVRHTRFSVTLRFGIGEKTKTGKTSSTVSPTP